MAVLEFVVFDANSKEVDWVDPVEDYQCITERTYMVNNGFAEYRVVIPEGGRYEVRVRS